MARRKPVAKEKPLSRPQSRVLEFIQDVFRTEGQAPTIREIAEHLGHRSPRSVQRHLDTLEERGYLTRRGSKHRSIALTERAQVAGLPLVGQIAAGSPLEAIEQAERFDLGTMYDPQKHFLLRVTGDSMIDDHIADGDLVVVRRQATCNNGDVVAAMIDGDATLKRFYRERHRIRLQPANRNMQPIYVQNLEILGIAVGVIRTAV